MNNMIDSFKNYINNIKEIELNLINVIDILIVSFLIYLIFYFFKKSHNFKLIVSILIIASIYFLSFIMNLYLTNTIFKYFSNIILIILIIAFQKEIRDFFNFLTRFKFVKKPPILKNNLEILITTIENLKNNRIGALFVIPGKIDINHYLENGYSLNGVISQPLIESILDPHSPGHDGAIVIKRNLIWKFGVHLPLAERFDQIQKFGLRHRAAVGITEKTDALAIVVSEEKGTISIAKNGKLEIISNINELKEKLINFIETVYPEEQFHSIKILIKNLVKELIFIFISIFISLSLFIFFNQKFVNVQRSFVVPIEFANVPPNYIVSKVNPSEVNIILQGKKNDFDSLDINKIKITIDLLQPKNLTEPGWHSILTNSKNVKIETNLKVVDINPSNIRFYVEKKETNE